jgi:LuxR family glucitol operon transcriptional activator
MGTGNTSAQLRERQEFEKEARMRWNKYYLDLVARSLTRNEFKEPYWNALPPYNRELIDPEWPNLQEVLVWSDQQGQDQILVELTLLLAHYMNALMLFPARLYYTQKAAEAASRLDRKEDAALLHIDGSGWILLEEGLLTDAIGEITTGLRIAQTLGASDTRATDLTALANAFLAMVFLEQGDLAEASVLMDKVVSLECSPAIQRRVSIVAGDIAYRKSHFIEAKRLYEDAYQIGIQYDEAQRGHNRLGNVYLVTGDLLQAEVCFNEVIDREQRFGVKRRSHAKYGLARIALAKGERDKARQMAEEVLNDLARTVTSHKLMDEIREFLKGLEDIS